jgi:ferrous iron transport protein A
MRVVSPTHPSLAELEVGAEAVVESVRCARPVARRLMEMGLLPGTHVEVVRVAPLGDPIELSLRGYSLSIRRSEAADIGVEPAAVDARARAAS